MPISPHAVPNVIPSDPDGDLIRVLCHQIDDALQHGRFEQVHTDDIRDILQRKVTVQIIPKDYTGITAHIRERLKIAYQQAGWDSADFRVYPPNPDRSQEAALAGILIGPKQVTRRGGAGCPTRDA
jgi:hypothetical protein